MKGVTETIVGLLKDRVGIIANKRQWLALGGKRPPLRGGGESLDSGREQWYSSNIDDVSDGDGGEVLMVGTRRKVL